MRIDSFIRKVSRSAERFPNQTFSESGTINTCVNPYSYHLVRNNYALFSQMDGLYVDGILMCILINILWRKNIPRLSFDMAGMAVNLFHRLNDSKETIYFIGAKQDALELSIKNISDAYPNMHIAGYRNGYFNSQNERDDELRHIVELNPDFVIVGMGSPLQEEFSLLLKEMGYKGIVFTCGGFLHQTTMAINYYPDWVNKYNLRAIYRLFHEKGLWGRLYHVLITFPVLFVIDTLHTKINNK